MAGHACQYGGCVGLREVWLKAIGTPGDQVSILWEDCPGSLYIPMIFTQMKLILDGYIQDSLRNPSDWNLQSH